MNLSIRSKVVLSGLVVGAVVFAVELAYLEGPLSASLASLTEASGERLVLSLATRLEGAADLTAEGRAMALRLGPRIGRRISILDPAARVVADSLEETVGLPDESKLDRPELGEALALGVAAAERVSPLDGVAYRWAVARIPRDGPLRGYVRLAAPLAERDSVRLAQRRAVLIASAVGLVAAVVIGSLLARVATGTLEQVAAAAEAIGQGELGRRCPLVGDDVVARIARTLNDLAEKHQQKLLALARDRGLLLALLDVVDHGIVVVDRQGLILASNGRFRELAEAAASPEGQHLGDVLADPDVEVALRASIETSTQSREAVSVTRTTRRRPLEGSRKALETRREEVDAVAGEALALRVRARTIDLTGIGPAAVCVVEPLERAKDLLQAEVSALLDGPLAGEAEASPAAARAALQIGRAALDLEAPPPQPIVLPPRSYGGADDAPSVFAVPGRLELALALLAREQGVPEGQPLSFPIDVGPTRVALGLAPGGTDARSVLTRRLAFAALRAAGGFVERGPDGRLRAVLARA